MWKEPKKGKRQTILRKARRLSCDILDHALRRFQQDGNSLQRKRLLIDRSRLKPKPDEGVNPKEE